MYDQNTTLDRRTAFSDGDIATASPQRVLIKCFDRLEADMDRGLAAIERHDFETANRELGHAQDLLGEIAGWLDADAWEHADSLLAVYDYVLRLLAVGSMLKESAPIVEARHLLAEIGDAFRAAADSTQRNAVAAALNAAEATGASSPSSVPTPTPPPAAPARSGGFSVLA
ncbi:MAG: flagellar export chaperone FliS [Actinomycetota bacterium]